MTEDVFFTPQESEWEEGTSPYDEDVDEALERQDEDYSPRDEPPEKDVTESLDSEPRGVMPMSVTAPRTGRAVLDWVRSISRWTPAGMCQQFTRMSFGVGSYYGTAADAWHGADKRHPTSNTRSIPPAVPVFWLGGRRGYGHAAVSLGNGLCRSTDWPSKYSVGTARIDDISRAWGQRFQGWTEDINEVTVYKEPVKPTLDASNIARSTKERSTAPQARRLKKAVAAEVGRGRMGMKSRRLGRQFSERYKLVQRKYLRSVGQKPNGRNDDGIPGFYSLTWLGKRHGFEVKK
jgi:hypothetical protein